MPDMPKLVPCSTPRQFRGTTSSRGYDYAHRKLREQIIAEVVFCERCRNAWGVHLHHKDRNPFNRDRANVELLCLQCHRAEHI